MIATLQEDFILAAHAKGVPRRRIIFRHALRPSSFSLATVAAINIGNLISGSVIIESLFAIPGLGMLTINSILNKDVVVVQGIVMFTALVYVLVNVAVDLLYRWLDPRVRLQQAPA
jgi:peptide/nickel transport system permease protein